MVLKTLLYYYSPCRVLNVSLFIVLGYGQTGPLSQRAGYDAVASAVSGMMHITGPEVSILLQTSHNFFHQVFQRDFHLY